jgi:hypothetical protein
MRKIIRKLNFTNIVFTIILIFGVILAFDVARKWFEAKDLAIRIVNMSNAKCIALVFQMYYTDNKKYPSKEKWCDLLLKQEFAKERFEELKEYLSYLALNSKVEPNSPPDTVLFFETTRGWNQTGSTDKISFDLNSGKGCNVTLNDFEELKIKYVKIDDVNKLKW